MDDVLKGMEEPKKDENALPAGNGLKKLRPARKAARIAKEERDSGFSYIFGLGAVKLCSLMETAVDDLVMAMLCSPECRQRPAVTRLKGSLVEFIALDHEEQSRHLADALAFDLKSTFKPGVGRFESLLDAIGLGGPVEDDVRREIMNLLETRNVLVHRSGRADKKFINNCPSLGFKEKDEVRIDRDRFSKYIAACGWYLLEMNRRLRAVTDGTEDVKDSQLMERVLLQVRGDHEGVIDHLVNIGRIFDLGDDED